MNADHNQSRFAIVVTFAALIGVAATVSRLPEEEGRFSDVSTQRVLPGDDLTGVSNATLLSLLKETVFSDGDRSFYPDQLVPVLDEMLQRRDPVFAAAISRALVECDRLVRLHSERQRRLTATLPRDYDARLDELPADQLETAFAIAASHYNVARYGGLGTVRLLAALRTLRDEPLPLTATIIDSETVRDEEITFGAQWPDFPRLSLSLRNSDPSQRRFRLWLRPLRPTAYWIGCLTLREAESGIAEEPEVLSYGRAWTQLDLSQQECGTVKFDLAEYYHPLPPGTYQLGIDRFEYSAACEFRIRRRVIESDSEEQARIRNWLGALDRSQPPQILDDSYGEWVTDVIPVESPLGRVLQSAWQAVPALLAELDDPTRSPLERAHTLAMLYSITGQAAPWWPEGRPIPRERLLRMRPNIAPSGPSALGPYYSHSRSMRDHRRRAGQSGRSVSEPYRHGFPGQPTSLSGAPDPNSPGLVVDAGAQAPIIERWRELGGYVQLILSDESDL